MNSDGCMFHSLLAPSTSTRLKELSTPTTVLNVVVRSEVLGKQPDCGLFMF